MQLTINQDEPEATKMMGTLSMTLHTEAYAGAYRVLLDCSREATLIAVIEVDGVLWPTRRLTMGKSELVLFDCVNFNDISVYVRPFYEPAKLIREFITITQPTKKFMFGSRMFTCFTSVLYSNMPATSYAQEKFYVNNFPMPDILSTSLPATICRTIDTSYTFTPTIFYREIRPYECIGHVFHERLSANLSYSVTASLAKSRRLSYDLRIAMAGDFDPYDLICFVDMVEDAKMQGMRGDKWAVERGIVINKRLTCRHGMTIAYEAESKIIGMMFIPRVIVNTVDHTSCEMFKREKNILKSPRIAPGNYSSFLSVTDLDGEAMISPFGATFVTGRRVTVQEHIIGNPFPLTDIAFCSPFKTVFAHKGLLKDTPLYKSVQHKAEHWVDDICSVTKIVSSCYHPSARKPA